MCVCGVLASRSNWVPIIMNAVRRLLNLSDIVPLNREWKAVKLNAPAECRWRHDRRRVDLSRHIQQQFLASGHSSVLLGVAGSGRHTVLNQTLDKKRHIPLVVKCENAGHYSFSAFLTELQQSIARDLASGFSKVEQPLQVVFRSITSHCSDFPAVLSAMNDAIQRGVYPCPRRTRPLVHSGRVRHEAESIWRDLCIGSSDTKGGDRKNATTRDALFENMVMVLMAAGEYCEHHEAYQRSKGVVQYSPSGTITSKYLFAAVEGLASAAKGHAVLVFRDAECLLRSTMMHDKGEAFLKTVIERTKLHPKLSTVLISDDPLLVLRLNSTVPNQTSKQDQTMQLQVLEIPEWSTATARQLVRETGCCADASVAEAVVECVGGVPERLSRFVAGLTSVNERLRTDIEAENQWLLKELRVSRVEIADLRNDATAQEMLNYEQLRRQQAYVRDAMEHLFARDMLRFQWKMNHFLALTVVQQFRDLCQTQLAFFVAVLETIRVLISRGEFWPLEGHRLEDINHPIIVGLLDARVLTYRSRPARLIPYEPMYLHFLRSFITEKIDQLSVVNRLKYNVTRAANNETIQSRLSRMTTTL